MSNASELNDSSSLYYNFFIYTDTGSCIFKSVSSKTSEDEIGAMNGIIQALFFSASDLKGSINFLSTDLGTLTYKSYQYKDNTILFALIFPNFYADETIAEKITSNLLDYIYHMLLIHIGITDLFSFKSSNDIEKLRKYLELYEKSINYILRNHSSINLLLKAERKYELEKDAIYSIKFYLEKIKEKLKIDLICLTVKNIVVWASSDWLTIDIVDRLLFLIISELYGGSDFNEIPIYFSKTPLEDEGIGTAPYKLFSVNLMKDTKMLLLTDNEVTIDKIDLSVFDDFFISRIIGLKSITLFSNDVINMNVKSMIVYNSIMKTYKIMIDEFEAEAFERFIMSCSFSDAFFNEDEKESEESISKNGIDMEKNIVYDEFYVKDSNNETFYYYRIGSLSFFSLFDKEKTFDDINSVRLTLKATRESFDNKENYKDLAELNKQI